MLVASRIEEMACRLHGYEEQMATITKALEALKVVGDLVSSSLAADRSSMLGLVAEIQEQTSVEQVLDCSEAVTAVEAAGETPGGEVCEFQPAATADLDATNDVDPVDAAIPNEAGIETADVPVPVVGATSGPAVQTAASHVIETEQMIAQIAAAAETADAKVIDLASRRIDSKKQAARPGQRRAISFVAAMLLAAFATAGMQEFFQTDMAQQLIGIGNCDAETAAASRECAVLAWLTL
jgi:hypothetical protein